MSTLRVIENLEYEVAEDDFLRVSCRGDEATGVFTTIERVLACEGARPRRFRRLFDGLLASREVALRLAMAYAEHKGVPVVYARTPQPEAESTS